MSGAPIGVSSELAVVRPPGVGGLDDPPQPQPQRLLLNSGDLRATALDLELGDAPGPQSITHRARLIAPVEMQGPDLVEQPCGVDGVDGGLEHGDVVAVGAVDRPAHRYAVTLGGDRPLPAELGPIRWIGAGSLAPIGRLVQRAIQGDIVEVEADDPVEGGKCLGLELLEHACMDPFITSSAQGGVGHLVVKDCLDIDPRRPRDQADHDPSEAQPIRHARPVASEAVGPAGGGQERLDRLPDDIPDFGLECTHDDGEVLPQVVGVGVHPA
jgi:hypothetical protein